jgi:hypothetical protein
VQWTSDARRFIEVAGMIIDPAHPIVDVGQNKAIGSLLIVQAENIEEARKIIEDDIYTQSGVVSGVHARLLYYSTSTVGQGEARYRAFYRGDAVSCVSLGQRVMHMHILRSAQDIRTIAISREYPMLSHFNDHVDVLAYLACRFMHQIDCYYSHWDASREYVG